MDGARYRTWWVLHLRAARGDRLSAVERAAYEAGLRELQHGEILDGDLAALREARAAVVSLEAEHEQRRKRREELEADIAALEAALGERTRQLLGVTD